MKVQGFPFVTLVLCLIAVGVHSSPDLRTLLIYDRPAILHGEWWRVLTSTVTHHSGGHLFWNLVVLGVFGSLLETTGRSALAGLLLLTAAGHTLFLFNPDVVIFAGMSGYVTAILLYLCLDRLSSSSTPKNIWILLLLVLLAKTVYEVIFSEALLASGEFLLLPQAHLQGIAFALLLYFMSGPKSVPSRNRLRRWL